MKVRNSLQAPKKEASTVTKREDVIIETDDTKCDVTSTVSEGDDAMVKFKRYYNLAKACGSKSITIDLKTETMTISVD